MYWRPVTQMVSFLPFGGVGSVVEAVSTPSASWRPSAPLFGGSWIEPSFANVTAERTTRISAAPTVQEISRRVLPWIWAATRPFLARNLISE